MKTIPFISAVILALTSAPVWAGEHTVIFGAHYFYTLDEISADLDDSIKDSWHDDGIGYNFGYRYKFNPTVGLLAEVQLYPNGYNDAESVISPRILAVFGRSIYAGLGIGWHNVEWEDVTDDLHESSDWSDSFYLLRLGLEFPIIVEHLRLDINGNYEFNDWNDVEEFQSDIITFGAGLKVSF